MRFATTTGRGPAMLTGQRRHFQFPHISPPLSKDEAQHLEQELPPSKLLKRLRTEDRSPHDEDCDVRVPGDSFGIMRNRVPFYKPIPRQVRGGIFGEMMPRETHPYLCANTATVQLLHGRYGVTMKEAVMALQEAEGNVNAATRLLQQRCGIRVGFGSYGVVAMESYAPETFCLVSFNLPSYEATLDDDVLDAIHELTLSAAELPLDCDRQLLVHRLTTDWTIEDGTPCKDVLQQYDITVKEVVMLPYGDYSVQGYHVLYPVKEDMPNIGVGAAACCLDLRTGIHNRFRFHVERIADSVSEHVLRDWVHYNQGVHLLRQPYWFNAEYSVEEFVRFKESLLQPSASIFEIRYATVLAPPYGLRGYRNLIELEKLKVAQHKHEKHYEEFTAPEKWTTSDNAHLQSMAAGSGGSAAPGAILHANTNSPTGAADAMETKTGPMRRLMEQSIQAHGDRVFARFYRNNLH